MRKRPIFELTDYLPFRIISLVVKMKSKNFPVFADFLEENEFSKKLEGKDMSTTMPKAADISRKWYVLDAAGKPLGRVAAKAADLLRGKHKPTFAPHMDCGDHVVIINCEKAVLTGRKLEQKYYRWHTGWVGHLKEIKYAHLMEANPEKAMMLAVKGMVPDTVIGRQALRRLRVYRGAEHKNQAQKPEVYEF